jgi:hypothetical protein
MTLHDKKQVVLDALDMLVEDTSDDRTKARILEQIQNIVDLNVDKLWNNIKKDSNR